MKIPVLSGVAADVSPEFRVSYPVNLVPVPRDQGISKGYLRPAQGMTKTGTGPGVSRGGIFWDGVLYRVMGGKLVSVGSGGTVTVLGDIPGLDVVSMAYSFDRLAVAADGRLFLWDKSSLIEVTDPDLGAALNVEWADGYFVTTDGEYIVVTDLTDPTSVDPLRYGSSEVDPDPVKAVRKVRNEIYAVNRYTVEAFTNVGGRGFPFQVVKGAQVHKGAVGTHASIVFNDTIAVLGGGHHESVGVHLCGSGVSQKISTREIDTIFTQYNEAALEGVQLEVFEDGGHSTLMVHLPDQTLCFDASASASMGTAVWYILSSGVEADQKYRGRDFVWAYNQWSVADTASPDFGYVDADSPAHWGDLARWEFSTPIIYADGKAAQIHSIELVGVFGATKFGTAPVVSAQWSEDGVTWSQSHPISAGALGERSRRLRWMRQGLMRQRRSYRFRGDSNCPISIATIEAEIEGLAW